MTIEEHEAFEQSIVTILKDVDVQDPFIQACIVAQHLEDLGYRKVGT